MTVAILGASANPERYSNRALCMLQQHGHDVVPVHPSLNEIDGVPVVASLDAIETAIDTLTVYLRPQLAEPLADSMIALAPRRVIFNPGTESKLLKQALSTAAIASEEACTLVLLQSGQFEKNS